MAHIDPRQGREKKAETGRGQDDGKHGPRQRASTLTQPAERAERAVYRPIRCPL